MNLMAQAFWHEFFQKFGTSIAITAASAVASFLFGRWWGNRKARQDWERKEFFERINVSLNQLGDGKLKIRTLMERPLEDIFYNKIAAQKVLEASKQTTVANPLLPIAKEDCWYLLNFVLNAVAEHFSVGAIRQEAGVPVQTVAYVIFLTCEVVGDERIRKVRAMLLRRELLEEFPFPDQLPELENPWHETRVQTLRQAAELWKTNPEHFLKMEICV
jgi:hypothetical protein